MNPITHALSLLNGRKTRKLASNTYARTLENGAVAVKLHATDILTFNPDGTVTVNSGGYKSNTTKARVNALLPSGFPRLYQSKGVWNWAAPYREGKPFATVSTYQDGDTFGARGKLRPSPGKTKEAARIKELTARINLHAQRCADALPLPMPSGGDDWFSALVVTEGPDKGKPLGEATGNTEHLESNMAEGYVVPSLVLTALDRTGAGNLIKSATFGQCPGYVDLARTYVKRAVRRYMKARFGIAGGAFRKDPAQTGFAVR